jgi:hypothetical protein
MDIKFTFPPTCGRCGGASNEAFPPVLRGTSPVDCIGPDICFGALIAGRPFLLVRRDIPLLFSSDILQKIRLCGNLFACSTSKS